MSGITSRLLIGAIFGVLVLVAVPAPAAAHDNNCDVAVHYSSVKVHQGCENKYKGDETQCFLSFNVSFIHEDFFCD